MITADDITDEMVQEFLSDPSSPYLSDGWCKETIALAVNIYLKAQRKPQSPNVAVLVDAMQRCEDGIC